MDFTELCKSERQALIAADSLVIDHHVAWAVHGLECKLAFVFSRCREHVGVIVLPMSGDFPKGFVHHIRSVDFLITSLVLSLAHIVDQLLEKRPTLGVPEYRARSLFFKVEQVQLLTELAVITLLGFGLLNQKLIQLLLFGEIDAGNTAQHGLG
ncbi:hypothetical protein D3C87_1096760 [compost metagenome]